MSVLDRILGETKANRWRRKWILWKFHYLLGFDRGRYCPAQHFMCPGCTPIRRYFEERELY